MWIVAERVPTAAGFAVEAVSGTTGGGRVPELEKLKCKCGAEEIPDVIKGDIHIKAICPVCGDYIKNLPKAMFEGPKKPNGERRKAQWTPKVMEIDYCEMCGREHGSLGKNEKLESHHKIPIQVGGEDVKSNILILCSPCHTMAHYLRTYLNNHLSHLHGA